jgi:hypothetical protein
MKFLHLLLFAAGVPLLASAQADRAMPAATDANTPVTPLQYHSVFADYVVAKEPALSPDKGWVSANRALMGTDAETAASHAQPAAGGSDKTSEPKPMHDMHDMHEHKGAHQ